MSVKRRKTKRGLTKGYYYYFCMNGKRYRGACSGCSSEQEAVEYEKKIQDTVRRLSEQKTVNALVENFKEELAGGVKIALEDAFQRYLEKPSRRQSSSQHKRTTETCWNDFCAFMRENFPNVRDLNQVTRNHAEKYIRYIKEHGRFTKLVTFSRGKKVRKACVAYRTLSSLSLRTINYYHKVMKSVFSKLREDAGLLSNPFDFEMMTNDSESRDAFTTAELKLINDNMDSFVKPIFVIGICTGLSRGDICTLRWDEIIDGHWIVRRRRKTGVHLEIPILPPLATFLREQKAALSETKYKDTEYVLPEHAKMYLENPAGLSYRFKKFLEGLGIKTTRQIPNRARVSSIKDIHSLRHTFAYLAGCYNVPLSVVQSILGHMSPEMTKHYQAHADREAKVKFLAQLPAFIGQTDGTENAITSADTSIFSPNQETSDLRSILLRQIQNMPEGKLEEAATLLKTLAAG